MSARAIWKGVLVAGKERVPVKLYSAVADRSVHFRLLHRTDKAPVRQVLVNPGTGKPVPYADSLRAWQADDGRRVLLTDDDLATVNPDKSRDIELLSALPLGAIDHRWYDRPYYLGPDGDDRSDLDALATALERDNREGLARWVMRDKEYLGALRVHEGHPMLVTLRHREQVVSQTALSAPGGAALDRRELDMSKQLIGMLETHFDPGEYQDEYRQRVMDLIDTKRRGGKVRKAPPKRRRASSDLTRALEASLKQG
ncbi:Ku protein [Alcanivorax marinus]|uniref:Ku protein n=1 Tax=Alloalcanivorax marinus TaxID=1177169 RepID=A0A9Q3UP80_9GAMM|nr:Ku protein [Alloalcanivorax marinus]MCC4310075.1 Ku protein [Alloalcanivorax marinus]